MTRFDPFGFLDARSADEVQSRRIGDVSGRLSAVERANALAAFQVRAPIVIPTLQNGFVQNPQNPLHYYADVSGRVWLEGRMTGPNPAPSGGTLIFTLDPAYLPDYPLDKTNFSGHVMRYMIVKDNTPGYGSDLNVNGITGAVTMTLVGGSWAINEPVEVPGASWRLATTAAT